MTAASAVPAASAASAIEARDLAVVRGGRPVLRGVDVTVPAGVTVALLGANGSGKSTLVRALVGLLPLAQGEVRIFGTPLTQLRERRRLGFVPQHSVVATGVPASVREVVATGRLAHRRLMRPMSRTDRRAVEEALEAVGMADHARDRVAALSGGQQQRVLIARALAGGADLLLLDEPTAGVDLPSQQQLADTLAALHDRGTTVLLVAHELGPLEPLVDRSLVLDHGRLVYDGPPRESAWEGLTWHGHHHPPTRGRDHLPEVVSPLEPAPRREGP